jgi:hypothetical protein
MVVAFHAASIAVLLLVTSAAPGQDEKDPRETQAQKDCLTGKVESGVALLAELYANTSNANFIYNQARCYEQNARPADAINRFREYLRVAKNISAEDKADVDHHIDECRSLQAEQEKKVEPTSPPAPASEPNERGTESVPTAAAPSPSPPPPKPPALDLTAKQDVPNAVADGPSRSNSWIYWTLGAVVVAGGAAAAIYFFTRSPGLCDGASMTCREVK